MIPRRVIPLFLLALLAGPASRPAEPAPIPLWPEDAPGASGTAPADIPTLTVHPAPAARANGTAVVICPGGGYGGLMMSYEGHDIARWLNARGVTGIVLKYRVAPYRHPAPLLDGQRAVRLARAHAAEWRIKPDRIGLMGFSAGGHLASTVGTHFDDGTPAAADPVDRFGCRPDFLVLVYPVISLGASGHGGSRNNLLGANAPADLVTLLSNELQVTERTPPTFLAHSVTDRVVSVENSRLFASALRGKHVPVELLELPAGDHGLGVGKGELWASWQTACLHWMSDRGLLGEVFTDPKNR